LSVRKVIWAGVYISTTKMSNEKYSKTIVEIKHHPEVRSEKKPSNQNHINRAVRSINKKPKQ
jgi:hypothetical protein